MLKTSSHPYKTNSVSVCVFAIFKSLLDLQSIVSESSNDTSLGGALSDAKSALLKEVLILNRRQTMTAVFHVSNFIHSSMHTLQLQDKKSHLNLYLAIFSNGKFAKFSFGLLLESLFFNI